jgi:hypothetical protein
LGRRRWRLGSTWPSDRRSVGRLRPADARFGPRRSRSGRNRPQVAPSPPRCRASVPGPRGQSAIFGANRPFLADSGRAS